MQLRDYQIKGIQDARYLLSKKGGGHKKIIYQSVTGAGKTVVACKMIESAASKGAVLFVAHRKELIQQCSAKLDAFGIRHDIVMGGHKHNNLARVFVGTIQSFISRLAKGTFDPLSVNFIVIDEAHRSAGDQYGKLLDAFPNATLVGFTATPTRGDEKGLGDIYTGMVLGPTYEEMFKAGHLVRPTYYAPYVPDVSKLRTKLGDFDEQGLDAVMNNAKLLGDIAGHYARHARRPDGSYEQGICFAVNVRHSIALAESFNAIGIRAAHLDGTTPPNERAQVIEAYRKREYDVLCNVGLFDEGFDVPECSVAVLARPTKSVVLHIQMIGRILRTAPGKTTAKVLDHAGNVLRMGPVESYSNWTLESGSDITEKHRKKQQKKDPEEVTCDSCGHIFFASKVCPGCGHVHEFEKAPQHVETAEGDLVELDAKGRREYSQEEKARWWSEIQGDIRLRGGNPGQAFYAYQAKFGCAPSSQWRNSAGPLPPSPEVASWMKSWRIRRRKSWEKQHHEKENQDAQLATQPAQPAPPVQADLHGQRMGVFRH